MIHGPRTGDVLCSPESDARFLVIDPGTAVGMPSLAGVTLSPGEPHPCSKVADATTGRDIEGGERYFDPITALSLLCIWPGKGSLRFDDRELVPELRTSPALGRAGRQASASSHPRRACVGSTR
jgi:hypothetical protein